MADILISGAVKPTSVDTPTDARTRVETFDEIENIENPFVGMQVYVIETGKFFVVQKLKSKFIGNIEIPNSAVDMSGVETITEDIDDIWDEL